MISVSFWGRYPPPAMGTGPASAAVPDGGAVDEVIEPVAAPSAPLANPSAQAEALSALGNLGYAPGDAVAAVARAAAEAPEADTAVLIRMALKSLAPDG